MLKYLLPVFLVGCSTVSIKPATTFSAKLQEMIAPVGGCPTVTQISALNGIMFKFAQPTRCAKSILGDPICVAPFVITEVTPDVDSFNGVTRNGRMFNISVNGSTQSFDSRSINQFTPPVTLPVGFGQVGDAMVAVKSRPIGFAVGTYFDGQVDSDVIESAAVLTADTEARVCGAETFSNVTTLFRRAPWGDKTLAYDLKDFLRVLPLPTIPAWPGLSPNLSNYYVGSVGMQAWNDWGVRGQIPADKKQSYGNYRAAKQGERMLVALMDIPFNHRLVILLGLAQDAIDQGAASLGGAVYGANGGHNSGTHLAMVKWLGWLTGDNRFKQKGPITVPKFGEQYHLTPGTNYYVPSHTINYRSFFNDTWGGDPSPASKPVRQYTEADKRQISYMLCCGALNWQAGYLALHILGQLDPVGSETDRRIMAWITQFRAPYSQEWNAALSSVGASTLPGWWGNGQPVSNFYWPTLGW